MEVRVENIGPKKAQEWIDRSHDITQRSLSKRRVERLVHAILEGQWQLTHQAIALNAQGQVLDGQHRLSAIVLAGQELGEDFELPVLVAYEADPATFEVIDTGASRSTADTLKIAGYTHTTVLAAAVRSTLTYDKLKGTTGDWAKTTTRFTTADVMGYLEVKANRERSAAAIQIASRVSTAVGRHGLMTSLSAASLIGMSAGKNSALGPDTMYEFFERLSDGAMLSSHSPILALRRWMIGDNGFSRVPHTYRRQVGISVIIKTLNDYMAGRERGVVSFKPGIERIPVLMTKAELRQLQLAEEAALEAQERAEG